MAPERPTCEHLLLEETNSVLWITLNRPEKLNAVNPQMRQEIVDTLDYARGTPDVRAIVVTGAGRAFCTGADIVGRNFPSPVEGEKGNSMHGRTSDLRWGWHRVMSMLWECEKPVIAAVNGWAIGFGGHLPLYCDLAIMSSTAQFREVWRARGLPVEAGGAYILPRIMPLNKAKEKLFFADPISADEALSLGMVNKVVAPDDLIPAAREWAERLAAGPTRILGIIKRQVQMSLDSTLERALHDEVNALVMTGLVGQEERDRDAIEGFGPARR